MAETAHESLQVLDYAAPTRTTRIGFGDVLVWFTPLWCAGVMFAGEVLGLRGPSWLAAVLVAEIIAFVCAERQHWRLAKYSYVVGLLVLIVPFLLPSAM